MYPLSPWGHECGNKVSEPIKKQLCSLISSIYVPQGFEFPYYFYIMKCISVMKAAV